MIYGPPGRPRPRDAGLRAHGSGREVAKKGGICIYIYIYIYMLCIYVHIYLLIYLFIRILYIYIYISFIIYHMYIYIYIYTQNCKINSGQMGSTLMGSLQKYHLFDRKGTWVLPSKLCTSVCVVFV